MSDTRWVKVTKEASLHEGRPVAVEAHGRTILLMRLDGKVRAHTAECSHYGGPLEEGFMADGEVTCPWHHARFDLRSGSALAGPAYADLEEVPVKVEKGQVLVGAPRPRPLRRPERDDGRTFVIVGGGAGGHAAAETLRREGFAGRIIILTAEDVPPYDRTALSKGFLAGKTDAGALTLRSAEFYREAGIEILTRHRAVALDPGAHRLALANGESLAYDRLLIATGGTPRRLDLPGASLDGVFVLRSLSDGEAILAAAKRAGSAAVIGASFIGLEVASALRQRGLEVHVIAPEPVPMARVFGPAIGGWLRDMHEKKGVKFHLGTSARRIIGRKKVEGVALDDGSRVATQIVIAGIGITPAVEWLEGSGLLRDGAVPVNAQMRTSAPDVFAVGDVALVPTQRGGAIRVEHWSVAQRQGRHAARSMLGRDEPYVELPFFWTRQYDFSLLYFGHAPTFEKVVLRGDVSTDGFLAGYYDGQDLLAAASVGRSMESMALEALMRSGRSISPEEFQDASFDIVSAARSRGGRIG